MGNYSCVSITVFLYIVYCIFLTFQLSTIGIYRCFYYLLLVKNVLFFSLNICEGDYISSSVKTRHVIFTGGEMAT